VGPVIIFYRQHVIGKTSEVTRRLTRPRGEIRIRGTSLRTQGVVIVLAVIAVTWVSGRLRSGPSPCKNLLNTIAAKQL
jgi:hypothetical protein